MAGIDKQFQLVYAFNIFFLWEVRIETNTIRLNLRSCSNIFIGASVFAAGSPDAIIVDSNAETKVTVVPDGDSDTPPDVYIKKPDGEVINPTGEH